MVVMYQCSFLDYDYTGEMSQLWEELTKLIMVMQNMSAAYSEIVHGKNYLYYLELLRKLQITLKLKKKGKKTCYQSVFDNVNQLVSNYHTEKGRQCTDDACSLSVFLYQLMLWHQIKRS